MLWSGLPFIMSCRVFSIVRPFDLFASVTGIKLIGTCGSNPVGLFTITHCLSRHLSRTLPPFLAPLAIYSSSSHPLTKIYIYIYDASSLSPNLLQTAHVFSQHLWHLYRATWSLKVFKYRDHGALCRNKCAVERMHKTRFFIGLVAKSYAKSSSLVV